MVIYRGKDPGSPGFTQQVAAATGWLSFLPSPWAVSQQAAQGLLWMAPSLGCWEQERCSALELQAVRSD